VTNISIELMPSLLAEAQRIADAEGVVLDQLVNSALGEKLSAMQTDAYFAERRKRADVVQALAVLERIGVGAPPVPGDEVR
jgi:hypothetical protein